MKKWIIIGLVIVAAGVAYYLQVKWQTLSILLAALAAPVKMIFGLFGGESETEIRQKHAEQRRQEAEYQQTLETKLQTREERIHELESQISDIDKKLASLDMKRAKVGEEVESMSLEDLAQAGRNYFGT